MQQLDERIGMALQHFLHQRLRGEFFKEGLHAHHDERLFNLHDFALLAAVFMRLQITQQFDRHHRIDRDHLRHTARTEMILIGPQRRQITRGLFQNRRITAGKKRQPLLQSFYTLLHSTSLRRLRHDMKIRAAGQT